MYSENAIEIKNLNKLYQIYEQPRDRLKQFMLPRMQSLVGVPPKKYYREFWALKEISLKIKKGETVGIIGRNGSGKSTLLQIICGILNPTSGTLATNGRIAALLELGSGFNPEFTGRENVYMNASVLGLSKDEINSRFKEITAFADIGEFIEQPVKTYSSGMMVRLAFAVIAHVNADILVIDEALAVGDAFFTQKCMRFLRSFMKSGTVLFVSHDTVSVKGLCSHAVWLEKGSIQQIGSPKEVCEHYLEAFYEAQQGKGSAARHRTSKRPSSIPPPQKDQRQDFINTSNLRNDLKVFKFDDGKNSFGKGGAQITNVEFHDKSKSQLTWIVGGEEVTLSIQAVAHERLVSPIVGFYVRDRLGQTLFGDNTYLSFKEESIVCDEASHIAAEFTFTMPILPTGDYSINVAIANGTQEDHVQHHWIHEAILFKSESSSVSTGLVGIPMRRINLCVLNKTTFTK